jgi:glycosyltransferase involved in cell wall biosynthesis
VVEEGQNALLTVPETPSELAGAIARVLDDAPLSARFGRRSRELFRERFEIERSVERMIDLYTRIGERRESMGGERVSRVESTDRQAQQTFRL